MFMVRKLKIVKMPVLSKLIYEFTTMPIEIPARVFLDTDKIILNRI